jgi:hypothetical protein
LEVAGESIIKSDELVDEVVSSIGNGGEDKELIKSGNEMIILIVFETGTINIAFGWVFLLAAL